MFYLYVIKGPKQFYTGCTGDLKRRLKKHQTDQSRSTKNRGPWVLVYYEASLSHTDVLTREKYLKTAWGKRYLKLRIKHSE